jgi:hypothetical protein
MLTGVQTKKVEVNQARKTGVIKFECLRKRVCVPFLMKIKIEGYWS